MKDKRAKLNFCTEAAGNIRLHTRNHDAFWEDIDVELRELLGGGR
jgi:hypothetical protein